MLLESLSSNPFRDTAWRWQRAKDIHEGRGLPTTRRLDTLEGFKWIKRALRFMARNSRVAPGDDAETIRLIRDFPAIYWAYRLQNESPNPQRDSIEAHILARESDTEVGYRHGLPPAVVEAYESLFFNVRERLNNRQFILHAVLGRRRSATDGLRESDIWKLYGYFAGPYMLDALETQFVGDNWCSTPDSVPAALTDDTVSTLKLKAAVAAKRVRVMAGTDLALLDQFTRFVEVERTTGSAGKTQDHLLVHVNALFANLPVTVGNPHSAGTKQYDTLSAELNYEEVLQAGTGQHLPNAAELEAMSFPPPPMDRSQPG